MKNVATAVVVVVVTATSIAAFVVARMKKDALPFLLGSSLFPSMELMRYELRVGNVHCKRHTEGKVSPTKCSPKQ